jgi:hypothetical protein
VAWIAWPALVGPAPDVCYSWPNRSFQHNHAQQNATNSCVSSIEVREVITSTAFYAVRYRLRCLPWVTVRHVCL